MYIQWFNFLMGFYMTRESNRNIFQARSNNAKQKCIKLLYGAEEPKCHSTY